MPGEARVPAGGDEEDVLRERGGWWWWIEEKREEEGDYLILYEEVVYMRVIAGQCGCAEQTGLSLADHPRPQPQRRRHLSVNS